MWTNILSMLKRCGGMFVDGTLVTLELAAVTVACGAVLGSILALMRRSRFKPISFIAATYVEIIRGTPLLLQLYIFYFFLPDILGLNLSKFASVSIALVCNSCAYVCEIVRAGVQAVDRGQTEAARSLGMSSFQCMTRIVLPQAVKNILPALCNEFVAVIKETSLASTFFVGDLMTQYNKIKGALYMIMEPLLVIGAIYFVLTFTMSKLIAVLERKMKAGD